MTMFDISQLAEQNPWWIDRANILKDHKISSVGKLKFQWTLRGEHSLSLFDP